MKIAIAGSTKYTKLVAETLNKNFEIAWVMTPNPRKIGRKQILTKNPLHLWALENKIESFLVEKRIDKDAFQKELEKREIDFLLVVDFGYLIPQWLLDLPKIAPLNIHPSKLPYWRGSSPGQFALLFQDIRQFGAKETAVTLMVMNAKLDQGPIISQIPFSIDEDWTQREYYDCAFNLICQSLAEKIKAFSKGELQVKEQPLEPTSPIAKRLRKTDSFIDWKKLKSLMSGNNNRLEIEGGNKGLLTSVLSNKEFCKNKLDQIKLVKNAAQAFSPWPNLWTIVPTNKGEKRMKIFTAHLKDERLVLDQVQIEGKTSCLWREIKNLVV